MDSLEGLDVPYFTERLVLFLHSKHREDVRQMLLSEDDSVHYSIHVDFMILLDADVELANTTILKYDLMRKIFQNVLLNVQTDIIKCSKDANYMIIKPLCHIRVFGLMLNPESFKANVSNLRSSDVGRYICLMGTVIRTGVTKMLEHEREFECMKCKSRVRVQASMGTNSLVTPSFCEGTPEGKSCKGTVFSYLEGSRVCKDYQEIKIQEKVSSLTMGSIPRAVLVICTDDLVDKCVAGDDVYVCGIVRHIWKPSNLMNSALCDLELMMEAFSIRSNVDRGKKSIKVSTEQRIEFEKMWSHNSSIATRDRFIKSVCPQLFGLYLPKLAVLLTIIGGVGNSVKEKGVRIRGESHLLLVGDPGTGKSQLLRFGAKLSARSVITTGVGTTSAGLTVSVVREASGYCLEAGALVLADTGTCHIDEFHSIRGADINTIHEAMEQGTVSIAKAGIVATLNTRASVIAALNPKGSFNEEFDLSVNTAIASPLLSRFDLIILLIDKQDSVWDQNVCKHIMDVNDASIEKRIQADGSEEFTGDVVNENKDWFNLDVMKQYVVLVKEAFFPTLSPASELILTRYYAKQRVDDGRNAARTTIRLLESLVRIAQAHARLMFRLIVLPVDSIMAILLIEASLFSTSILPSEFKSSNFPDSPDDFYNELELRVLQSLDIVEEVANLNSEFPQYNHNDVQYDHFSGRYKFVHID